MTHKRLLVFNPETDFALASGLAHYTPPSQILAMRRVMALFPAVYAAPGDAILIPDIAAQTPSLRNIPDSIDKLPYFALAEKRGIEILSEQEVAAHASEIDRVVPWGWNLTMRTEMEGIGIPDSALPSPEEIDRIRKLAHRRLAITFNRALNESAGLVSPIPTELNSVDEAVSFMNSHPGCYFKSPWSSSGRGVMVGGTLSDKLTREWLHGAIRRQGSVMAETPCRRAIDFATEWICTDGKARFAGISLFTTTPGGSYLANILAPQQHLKATVEAFSPIPMDRLIDAQREILDSIVAPHYSGPLGIDACASDDGDFRPCLEINMRMTMGMVSCMIPTPPRRAMFHPMKATIDDTPVEYFYNR